FSKVVTTEIFPMILPCDSLIQFVPVLHPKLLPLTPQTFAIGSELSAPETTSFVVILT
ncbi:hypothetical protein SK128_022283, partial [Halocaridina rubra]